MHATFDVYAALQGGALDTDVLVIGCGAAGATAAMTACDSGARVLVVDKAPEHLRGGNSRVSGQIVFWPNDVGAAVEYLRAMAGPYQDGLTDELIGAWATEMHENRRWLESLGFEAHFVRSIEFPTFAGSHCVEVMLHGKGPYGEARLWDQVLEPAYRRRSIPTLYDAAARRLSTDGEGEISGAIVDRGGTPIRITAQRAVILACGGFQNDQAMIRNYLSDLPCCYPLGTPYNTGDGIRLAMDVGAELWHMNNLAGPMLAFKAPEHPVSCRLGTMKADSYIYVAGDGDRFIGEGTNFKMVDGQQLSVLKHGKVMRNGRYVQFPSPLPIHMIFDEQARRAGGVCGSAAGFTFGWDIIHGDIYQWSADNEREIAKGWIKKARSIDELARSIGLQPDVLAETVSRYNEACRVGIDPQYAREPGTLAPLREPPYYAIELTPASLNTQGGPVRNARAQVMGVSGQPIPRLYSAGELGSIYGYRYQAGGNLGECFAFGRIAGRNAAREPAR